MSRSVWSRRSVLAGLAAAPWGSALAQAAPVRPWSQGVWADNPIARSFEAPPAGLRLPPVMLAGPGGRRPLADLRGRALLIPLWAEWCTPCLLELPDFAELQARHGGPRFAITPIMTASSRKLDPAGAAQLLAKVKAARFEPLVEPDGGRELHRTVALRGSTPTLPCNLLVNARGRVVARQFGAMTGVIRRAGPPAGAKPPGPGGVTVTRRTLTEAEKEAMIKQASSGSGGSLWASPHGAAFVSAIAAGLLERS